jgi:hypothetical protein
VWTAPRTPWDSLYRRNDPGDTVDIASRRTLRLELPEDATPAVREGPPRLVSKLPDSPEH